jgi:threonine aldolase
MMDVEVGDDGFGEDPTTNKFEKMAAERLGKEDALFVASGVMGNLIAIMVYTKPGDGLICDKKAHINTMASGNTAALAGVTICPLDVDESGRFDMEELESCINLDDTRFPKTSLIVLENTNNLAGGTVVTPEETSKIYKIAKKYGLKLHLDGARIFNSAIAQGVDVAELTKDCDSVMFCISKGLASPVGSIIAGTKEFIAEARRKRKMLGGGMRQTGILAACGIIALEEMIDRMKEDHDNARYLAEGLAGIEGFSINLDTVQTNIIYFKFELPKVSCKRFVEDVSEKGVYTVYLERDYGRMVTHKDLNRSDIDYALEVIKNTVSGR